MKNNTKSKGASDKNSVLFEQITNVMAEGKSVSVVVLAKFFGLTSRRVQQLVDDGVLPAKRVGNKNIYEFLPCAQAYIHHLQSKAAGQETKLEKADLERKKLEEEVGWKGAKREMAEIELAVRRGEVHRAEHVREMFEGMISYARAGFLSIPGRVAMDVAGATPAAAAKIIKDAVCAVLANMVATSYDPTAFSELVREEGAFMPEEDDGTDEE